MAQETRYNIVNAKGAGVQHEYCRSSALRAFWILTAHELLNDRSADWYSIEGIPEAKETLVKETEKRTLYSDDKNLPTWALPDWAVEVLEKHGLVRQV